MMLALCAVWLLEGRAVAIAWVGHAVAHAPQPVQASGFISSSFSPAAIAAWGHASTQAEQFALRLRTQEHHSG